MKQKQRTELRLPAYDYSKNGAYFLTLCVQDKKCILSSIVGGGVLDAPQVRLSKFGQIVKDQIEEINQIYSDLQIVKYVIMPNHVHLLVEIGGNGASGTPPPTKQTEPANARIPLLISAFKRFTDRKCGQPIWQRSYYDHVIRNEKDYQIRWTYIDNNHEKWAEDDYYMK